MDLDHEFLVPELESADTSDYIRMAREVADDADRLTRIDPNNVALPLLAKLAKVLEARLHHDLDLSE